MALGEKPLLLAAEPRLQIGAEVPGALHDAPADGKALRLEPTQRRLDGFIHPERADERHRSAEAVMAETALLDFLYA